MPGGPTGDENNLLAKRAALAALRDSRADGVQIVEAASLAVRFVNESRDYFGLVRDWMESTTRLLGELKPPPALPDSLGMQLGRTGSLAPLVRFSREAREWFQAAKTWHSLAPSFLDVLDKHDGEPWQAAGVFAILTASLAGRELRPLELALVGVASGVDEPITSEPHDGDLRLAYRQRCDSWRKRLKRIRPIAAKLQELFHATSIPPEPVNPA